MVSQNIVILGLSEVGTTFLKHMQELKSRGVNILGVYHQPDEASAAELASSEGIKSMSLAELVDLGEKVDMVFDLTGNRTVRSELRKILFSSNNQHTVIAPECIVQLMYNMMGGELSIPAGDSTGY